MEDTVEKLSATVQKIKETVESGGTVVPDPEPPVTEEYPAWEPYNGIPPVPYQVGSKVTYNGKKVGIHGSEQCLGTRCIWGRPEHLERSSLKQYSTHLQEGHMSIRDRP